METTASDLDPGTCPLCSSGSAREYCRDKRRQYLRCDVCRLIFVPASQFLSREAEKQRYDLHRNAPHDPGYRAFLNRLFAPLNSVLPRGSSGLDFGSGPEPVLSRMFEEAGHSMTRYDRYYETCPEALDRQYDFIIACEVAEHLREPAKELELLWACLKPGGKLGIMTQLAVDLSAFPAWQYKNDLTHICYYSPATFEWLARRWNAELTFPEKDVAVFHKPASLPGPVTGDR